MSKPTAYLAGPVSGCTDEEASLWRDQLSQNLPGVRCVSPVRCELPNGHRFRTDEDSHFSSPRGISAKNWLDTERADVIVAFMPEEHFSLGTAIECGWAIGMKKPVILITDDYFVSQNPLIQHNVSYEVFSTRKLYLDMGFSREQLDEVTDLILGLVGVYQ